MFTLNQEQLGQVEAPLANALLNLLDLLIHVDLAQVLIRQALRVHLLLCQFLSELSASFVHLLLAFHIDIREVFA